MGLGVREGCYYGRWRSGVGDGGEDTSGKGMLGRWMTEVWGGSGTGERAKYWRWRGRRSSSTNESPDQLV